MNELISQIYAHWNNSFSDVPWTNEPIQIDIPKGMRTWKFRFMFDSLSEDIRVTPYFKNDNAFVACPESEYTLYNDYSTQFVTLECSEAHPIGFIKCTQLQAIKMPGRLVCLAQSQNENDWVVIYNSIDREKLLFKNLAEFLAQIDQSKAIPLLAFFDSLLRRDFNQAATIIEKNTFWSSRRKKLQIFCEKYAVQFNAHGIRRTFKYWSKFEKISYLESTIDVMICLNKNFEHVCLGFGAVLGLERDQDLIDHDDDLDILVAIDQEQCGNLPSGLSAIQQVLTENGFKVEGVFFSHLWVRHPAGHRCDVFLGLIEADGALAFYPSTRHSLRKEAVFPAHSRKLLGVDLNFPRDIPTYLDRTYGSNWIKPDNGFQHPWNRDLFQDLDGPRQKPALMTRGELATHKKEARVDLQISP